MTILPAAYMGSVEYFARLLTQECVIDIHEHYVKRSCRNRARILTSGGVMALTVHLQHANRPQTPVSRVRIDYSKRWQHQHWVSIVSAYRSSPYFDHYAPALEGFFSRRFDLLLDLDLELTATLLGMLGCKEMPALSDRYVEASASDTDLRLKRTENGAAFHAEPYFQLFSDRLPFAPNLSIIDLLFAEGPASAALLRRSLR